MGFFDFLNPKKKFQNLLAEKVKGPAIDEAVRLIKEKGEEKAKDELSGYVAEKVGVAVNELGIPPALDGIKDKLVEEASGKIVDEAFDEAKKRIAAGQARSA